jgi:hypothetical protein
MPQMRRAMRTRCAMAAMQREHMRCCRERGAPAAPFYAVDVIFRRHDPFRLRLFDDSFFFRHCAIADIDADYVIIYASRRAAAAFHFLRAVIFAITPLSPPRAAAAIAFFRAARRLAVYFHMMPHASAITAHFTPLFSLHDIIIFAAG